MSLVSRRDVLSRRHELTKLVARHQLALRQLHSVTACLANNTGLPDLLNALNNNNEQINTPVKDTVQDEFLQANSLLRYLSNSPFASEVTASMANVRDSKRYFDESTLPFPSIPQHDGSIYASKPNRYPTHSPPPVHESIAAHGSATEATLTNPAEAARPMAVATLHDPFLPLRTTEGDVNLLSSERHVAAGHGEVSVRPAQVAPPSVEDEANFSAATKELLDLESPRRPAKTIHLPPQDVQEEALRQRLEAREDARRRSDPDKAPRPTHLQPQAELASSPSSTVGAYSMTTPMPAQESPDTSPDSATARDQVLPPDDLRPSSEEVQEQEEHDRILAAQKEIARKEAFGEPTPDDQLNWEAREAAAREDEERRAREEVNGPEPDVMREADTTEAEQVMDGVQIKGAMQPPITPAPSHDEKLALQSSAAAPQPKSMDPQDDGDSITVVPRTRLPPIDTGKQGASKAWPQPRITGVSSGAVSRSSILQTAGEANETSQTGRQVSSPEPISPTMNMRRSQYDEDKVPAVQMRTPRRHTRQLEFETPNNTYLPLPDLAPLKGLAGDPERDYLEPLFRIQAHDSPNSQTRALPDLVKSAQKYMSTEDHFTMLHERMDHRILRRIYHLQNANKWSLRQMERPKEPAPPVTHLDHMMAEMRWMRKDFKAERKTKKSVCMWLAARCAGWVAAAPEFRTTMQVKVKSLKAKASGQSGDQPPDLETSGESAPEDDLTPATPTYEHTVPMNLVVAPELTDVVCSLQKAGQLRTALQSLPIVGLPRPNQDARMNPLSEVSRFVAGKILPQASGPQRKRSRYDYADDADEAGDEPSNKRSRADRNLPPEEQEVALFHPDNKHIRDRLHANNAFRPPSEFVMPATSFYEFRNGSQWVWEDDQTLRKLAKDYSFNWSLIADEMTLPSHYKSSADRRTPWECFERWVELDSLPVEMRKTMYFKTWFQRLEQSQQAAERRYQSQVQLIQSQAQAQNGQQAHVPQRRRTVPTRVEKRKNTRYLWLVDAMRKNAKKRENNAYKQAEGECRPSETPSTSTDMTHTAQRAAAQRKSQNDNNVQQRTGPQLTPQEFSKKRQERDLQIAEAQRVHRQKMMEAQQRQLMQARVHQQGGPNGQQRPGSSGATQQHGQMQANGHPNPNMNGQMPQQARPPLPMATRNGHLAVPQVNAQGIPQAQMQPNVQMSQQQQQQMARIAQVNAQRTAQYSAQQYQMANGTMPSPGSNMTTQQQLQHNQALLAQMSAQAHSQNQASVLANGHQMSASPSMPPPPTPHSQQQQQQPQQLSSGHVPALMVIKNQLRSKHPHLSEDQLTSLATSELRQQSQNQTQSSNQARQSAMNAAAGIPTHQPQPQLHPNSMQQQQAYAHNQQAFQQNSHTGQQMNNGNSSANSAASYIHNGTDTTGTAPQHQQQQGAPPMPSAPTTSPQAAAAYANQMRQRQAQMMRSMQSPTSGPHAQLNGVSVNNSNNVTNVNGNVNNSVNGSPALSHASPSMTAPPGSPALAYAGAAGRPGMPGRMGSANGTSGLGMSQQSPAGSVAGSSPRGVQASMAR
ncbi:RNA polymerase II transcription elongation factor SpEAF [Friedmanniomyces endolithicus]|nr:RNA polymerase II transcription elongation factor SpEAF [Friedmanniomyces endolithicus]KAK0297062.1 RNA polymerase II transcription elongation factor SpEAF [Friedmanniomyces endolithicus]